MNLTYSLVMSQHVPGMTKQHFEEPQYQQFPAHLQSTKEASLVIDLTSRISLYSTEVSLQMDML